MISVNSILDFLFPPVCICCKRALHTSTEFSICDECLDALSSYQIDEPKPIGDESITKCYCIYIYNKVETKGIIYHIKNIFGERFSNFIPIVMKESLIKHNLVNQIDIITFCPRKKLAIKRYGFDQGEELAKCLSIATSIPYDSLILRHGKSKEQKRLTPEQRKKNVKNEYYFDDSKNVKEKTVLLIDDVVTTGSTIKACAKELKAKGAKDIYVLAIAD